ncbi:hypothetical protein CCACVL1_10676 [Corchorus capsularis]|uniref:Uncharacterized protein n=1 Tax=Corchorus capsularis TaxID=210143 RepID=A0A1R3IQ70_COCAP|nr:hypothetical protein CCACVL1_10676 [Corchorus capsularis]
MASKKVELATQDKFKQKADPKKPNVGVKNSGETLKQLLERNSLTPSYTGSPSSPLSHPKAQISILEDSLQIFNGNFERETNSGQSE